MRRTFKAVSCYGLFIVLFCGLFVHANEDVLFDNPDVDEETRLHNIFSSYNSQAMAETDWEQIAGEFKGEDYLIQSGDTLWEISKTLFGDGFYWPKIWALNDRIENPHQIEPGFLIRFFEGSFYDAPSVSIVSKVEPLPSPQGRQEDDGSVADLDQKSPELLQQVFDARNVVLPPPSSISRPLMKQIPGSLPNMEELARQKVERMGRDLGVRSITVWPSETYVSSFVANERPKSLGLVVETERNIKSATINEMVYVQVDQGTRLGKGSILSTFRPSDNLFDRPTSKVASYLYSGELEVEEVIDEKENVYRCRVKTSINPTVIGDQLLSGSVPLADFYEKGTSGSISGEDLPHIFGGEFDESRKIFANQAIVFVDRGTSKGVEMGQLFTIYANPKIRGLNNLIQPYHRAIGALKVVSADKEVSTAIIVRANEEIFPGDNIGTYVKSNDLGLSSRRLISPQMINELESSISSVGSAQ